MFCSKCGNILRDGARYCPSCGAAQTPHDTAVNTTPNFTHGQPLPSVTFGAAIRLFFSNYANFHGRSRRSEYWYIVLFMSLVSAVLGFLSDDRSSLGYALSTLWGLATLIPGIALAVRRMHDVGKSGLYLLWSLLPLAGWIIVLIPMLQDSQPGNNPYGPNPKFCC